MLSWEFPPRIIGGISRHVEGLSKAFTKMGHEIHIVTLDFPNAAPYEQRDGYHIHRVPVEIPSPNFHTWVLLFNNAFEKKIGQILHRFGKPDIVHSHDWLTVPAGISAKHMLRTPMAMTFHSTEQMRAAGADSPESEMVRGLEWWGAFESTYVITVSKFMKSHVTSTFGLPMDKVHMIYNAIDVSMFDQAVDRGEVRKKWGVGEDDKLVATVGRLTPQKGFDNLIRSFPKIMKEMPEARLMIIGGGYMMNELEELTRRSSIEDRVVFTGFVSDRDLVAGMKAADLMVIPSRFEPFGMVALEGMAAGVPLVVAGIEGLSEIVTKGVDGLYIDQSDIDDISQVVVKALSDGELMKRLAANAKKKIRRFGWDAIARKTMITYRKAMEDVKYE
jgi:glycogen(starch) synthase